MAHSKLEDPRESSDCRRSHGQALEDAKLRVSLHDPNHFHDGLSRHDAVGIKGKHEIVLLAPALEEVANIACLEAFISIAPPVEKPSGCLAVLRPGYACRFFLRGDGRIGGIAQHEIIEDIVLAGGSQTVPDNAKAREDARRIFIPHSHDYSDPQAEGLQAVCSVAKRRRLIEAAFSAPKQPESQKRVPETCRKPRQGRKRQNKNCDLRKARTMAVHSKGNAKSAGKCCTRAEECSAIEDPAIQQNARRLNARRGHRCFFMEGEACGKGKIRHMLLMTFDAIGYAQ